MMEPAEHDAVVSMGWTAVDVFEHVVDLAPRHGDKAPGDEASAVTKSDGTTLTAVEDPLFGPERLDPAVVVEQHPLDHTCAAGVLCCPDADRLIAAFDMRPSCAGDHILGTSGDDESRGGPADRRQQFAGGGDEQCGRERVVQLLRPRARLRRHPGPDLVAGPELHRPILVDTR